MDAIGIQHLSENTARLAQKELSINWERVMKARSQTRERILISKFLAARQSVSLCTCSLTLRIRGRRRGGARATIQRN